MFSKLLYIAAFIELLLAKELSKKKSLMGLDNAKLLNTSIDSSMLSGTENSDEESMLGSGNALLKKDNPSTMDIFSSRVKNSNASDPKSEDENKHKPSSDAPKVAKSQKKKKKSKGKKGSEEKGSDKGVETTPKEDAPTAKTQILTSQKDMLMMASQPTYQAPLFNLLSKTSETETSGSNATLLNNMNELKTLLVKAISIIDENKKALASMGNSDNPNKNKGSERIDLNVIEVDTDNKK
ncbi:hypothetical protein TCON_1000 [Astathelohania contejeani]|uniref:Uncharacterized protein n=1 Tax=Astathelohania contejeani TaxID=164912 RepID=A0ABQ7I090_9MICR|nr:hypothetical protein TCON_1000 [Thelohania contejeani]